MRFLIGFLLLTVLAGCSETPSPEGQDQARVAKTRSKPLQHEEASSQPLTTMETENSASVEESSPEFQRESVSTTEAYLPGMETVD